MSRKEKLLETARILSIIVILSLALRWLIPTLTSEKFKFFVERLGYFGPLVVIFYTILSHVFAPLAGTPGILLSVTVFGLTRTMVYLYFASMASATISFYISRRFGRKWVAKLVGKKAIAEIDDFIEVSGTKVLILSRVFGFSLFELISYAAGLTKIKFQKYFALTLIFSLVPNFVFAYFFRDIDFSSEFNLFIWLATLITAGAIFSIFIKTRLKKKKERPT